jgi:hypothetical protein
LDRHALNPVLIDARTEGGLGKSDNAQARVLEPWPPGLLADGDPDFERCLGVNGLGKARIMARIT